MERLRVGGKKFYTLAYVDNMVYIGRKRGQDEELDGEAREVFGWEAIGVEHMKDKDYIV